VNKLPYNGNILSDEVSYMEPALKGLIIVIIGKSKIILMTPVAVLFPIIKNNRLSSQFFLFIYLFIYFLFFFLFFFL
jgi:hypothetical protein